MSRRTPRIRAYAPDPDAPGRCCDMPGCDQEAAYRAPKDRSKLRDYWWFCLGHVREYNASWDFYKGMTPGEIEMQTRADTGWQRPTWPLGRLGSGPVNEDRIREKLDGLTTEFFRAPKRPGPAIPAELRQPLSVLGLAWPVSLDQVKARYKELAKIHHPDANGGDRGAEERLKTINLAYAALRSHLAVEPGLMAG